MLPPTMQSFALSVAALAVLAGCGPDTGGAPELENEEWLLQAVETPDRTFRPVSGRHVSVMFTGEAADDAAGTSRLHGNAGCNQFFGGYSLGESGELAVGDLGATRMMCPDSVMATENALLTGLPGSARYSIVGTELIIEGAGGVLRFTASRP